ncbi:MAG: metalloregulator ArsR/SmtB family transcription factor [Thermaerobacter sp.]|jgi:ArsR family transcriptional regulator|nr:metalloregulator ArsR/SmtB family transcription factor [Thermaerobacter sp.]MDA8145270.1 metalloregulator ArsR/SmtB family transcription factor [Thermaerobacter sp.]
MTTLPDRRLFDLHASVCRALADPKRVQLMVLLRNGERSVQELAAQLEVSPSNLSQHLAVLRRSFLAGCTRVGGHTRYHLANRKFAQAFDLFEEALAEELARRARVLGGL